MERGDVVTLDCLRRQRDGRTRLVESHHDLGASERVHGRVIDLHVVDDAGAARPILRVPSGADLREVDAGAGGHLQDPWTGEVVDSAGTGFLVTVETGH